MSCKVSFIGLGVMGYPMAGYISKAGHDVTVYNRTKAKAEKWANEHKGNVAETPMDAAKDCDFVFTCVGNDKDLEEVVIGKQGIYNTIKKNAVHIDNTTASAEVAKKLYSSAKAHGWGFLDAPISGGQAGAEGGALTVRKTKISAEDIKSNEDKNILESILGSVTNIADMLKEQYDLEKENDEKDRKSTEKTKRKLQESGLEKAFKEGSAIAKDLLESYAKAEFFTKLPELPETIELVTFVAGIGDISTDLLSPGGRGNRDNPCPTIHPRILLQ